MATKNRNHNKRRLAELNADPENWRNVERRKRHATRRRAELRNLYKSFANDKDYIDNLLIAEGHRKEEI